MDFSESLLGAMFSGEGLPKTDHDEAVFALKRGMALMNAKESFEPGQIVYWKQNLDNKRPAGPFIVMEAMDEPIKRDGEKLGPYYNDRLDIVAGYIEEDGTFNQINLDSRRLTGTRPEEVA